MKDQYSLSAQDDLPLPEPCGAVLALDTGSPTVSVALSLDGEVAAQRADRARNSSSRLLEMIDDCLETVNLEPAGLDLLVGVRGPGSFTGLRVGLATLQGMHQALGIPTATVTTFEVLASLGAPEFTRGLTCVDAMRDEWMVQEFDTLSPPLSTTPPRVLSTRELVVGNPGCLIGFGASRLHPLFGSTAARCVEPGPLAPQALRLLTFPGVFDWHATSLSEPLYLMPPAATRPAPAS